MMTSSTPRLGVGPDYSYEDHPVIVLRLSEDTAEQLRAFLQAHDVGNNVTLWEEVYHPLRITQQEITEHFENAAEAASRHADVLKRDSLRYRIRAHFSRTGEMLSPDV